MPQIMINGCNVAYEEHGTGTNTVLFLHDLFFNGRCFNQQIIALRDRYRCITLDLRGHGDSLVSAAGFELDTLAHDVNQFIDVKRYGSCHLVGAGFGGAVAVKAALDRPERTSSLTLIGTALGDSTLEDSRLLRSKRLHIKLFGMRFVTKGLMRRAFSAQFINDSSQKEQLNHCRREFLKLDRRAMPNAISAYLARPPLLEELYKLRHPALIVGGSHDSVISSDDFTQAQNMIDGARLTKIADAGHSVHIEKPNSVNPALLEFLRST